MPTKRRQDIPGMPVRPSRNSAASRRGAYGAHGRQGRSGFSTSGPVGTGYRPTGARPSVQTRPGAARPSVQARPGASEPKVVFSRRNLLIGAAAVGGVAALAGGVSVALDALGEGSSNTPEYLEVAEDAVSSHTDYSLIEDAYSCVQLTGSFKLPYGTLAWADGGTIAACLTPTDSPSPLNTVSLLFFSTGNNPTVLEAALGAAEGFEIFDVRASETGLLWLECNTYTGQWRVHTATLSGAELGEPLMVAQGDSTSLLPQLAVVGNTAFWQVNPNAESEGAETRAVLHAAVFGSADAQEAYVSKRAFATRPTPAADGVVVTPLADATGTYYQPTLVMASDFSVADQLTLPASMEPDVAGHGTTGFAFGFSAIYSYGGGIANLGTYTPASGVEPFQYAGVQWMRFARTPVTPPCWCGKWVIVKSTTALCGIDPAGQQYFALDVESGADDYGEHLISNGTCDVFAGLSQVTSDRDSEDDYALVRVFAPVEA